MRLHYLQHVWFEDLGMIEDWALGNNSSITRTAFYNDEPLPDMDDIDWLFIMGGPMNIYQYDQYPWLRDEKSFIKSAIDQGKQVVGVCLGAQLIADVLGAKVVKQKHKEIGWFPMRNLCQNQSTIFSSLPKDYFGLHWHQDTFDIPFDAIRLSESEACRNQGFSCLDDRVIGLQFHLELKKQGIARLVRECAEELEGGPYVQSENEILQNESSINESHQMLFELLDHLFQKRFND